jgi:hypothetical protein
MNGSILNRMIISSSNAIETPASVNSPPVEVCNQ